MSRVYLAGGITGNSYEEATEWRRQVADVVERHNGVVLDPMRGKDELKGVSSIAIAYPNNDPTKNSRTVFSRDLADVEQCDIFFVNFYTVKSVGTPFELGYAYALGKHIISIAPEPLAQHPFIRESADLVFTDFDAALIYLEHCLQN